MSGHVFDFVFKHCSKIKTFHLVDATLRHCDLENITVHNSIEELDLDDCNLGEGAIATELSARLPNLKFLNTCHSYFCFENDVTGQEHLKFIMPNTSFNAILWTGWLDDHFRIEYYLKLILVNGTTTYYRGLRDRLYMEQVFPDTEQWEWNKNVFTGEGPREDQLLVEIVCKSIKIFCWIWII